MKRFLCRWVAAAALLFLTAPSLSLAADTDFQDLHPNAKAGIIQPAQGTPADQGDTLDRPAPTLCYAVAVLSAVVVLCILCAPSRKAESSTSR
jgi:hypothetical protein